ncbi:zinc ribbon domain-containing protein [Microseira sp. BLCC-F43]|uniref:zinc ribbon domain-containing protein n=1 Tax=Microseira sp. BLCC-F43 TaxID=3153602 RepID=UPI0035BA8EFD
MSLQSKERSRLKLTLNIRCTECRNCLHIDRTNRDGEKFICSVCGFFAHTDITASKNYSR